MNSISRGLDNTVRRTKRTVNRFALPIIIVVAAALYLGRDDPDAASAADAQPDAVQQVREELQDFYGSRIYGGARCDSAPLKAVWYIRCYAGEVTGGVFQVVLPTTGEALLYAVNGKALQHSGVAGIDLPSATDAPSVSTIVAAIAAAN